MQPLVTFRATIQCMATKERAIAAAVKALQRRNEGTQRLRDEFTTALLAAREAGATYEEIGDALKMSHVAVMKFVRKATE